NLDHCIVEIDLVPAQAPDLSATGGGVDQQLDDAAVVVVPERGPQGPKLVVTEHPVAGGAGLGLVGVDGRGLVEQSFAHEPREVSAKRAVGVNGGTRTIPLGNVANQAGNQAAVDARKCARMQRPRQLAQAILDLLEAPRSAFLALYGQVAWEDRAKSLCRLGVRFSLVYCWIAPEPDGGEQVLGPRASSTSVEHGESTEGDAPGFAGDVVLNNPTARTTRAHAQPEGRQGVIPERLVLDARREGERLHGSGCELHLVWAGYGQVCLTRSYPLLRLCIGDICGRSPQFTRLVHPPAFSAFSYGSGFPVSPC